MSKIVVSATNVNKSFKTKSNTIKAVSDVNLELTEGTIYGLLGPNGAGKTTLIKMLSGLIIPDSGDIRIRGIDVVKRQTKAVSHVGCVLEGSRNVYLHMKAIDNLKYFGYLCGLSSKRLNSRIAELLELVDLEYKANEYVYNLSRGMQQKLAIAVALLKSPSILFLDEPTLGLDVMAGYRLKDTLRYLARQNSTIIITTHDMLTAQQLCEDIGIMNKGRLVEEQAVPALITKYSKEVTYQIQFQKLLLPTMKVFLSKQNLHWTTDDESLYVHIAQSQTQLMGHLLSLAPPLSISVQHETLEDIFVKIVGGTRCELDHTSGNT